MNLSAQDLTAIKHLIDNSNIRQDARFDNKLEEKLNVLENSIDSKLLNLEASLIKRIDKVDYVLSQLINGLSKEIKKIKKSLHTV
jgi:hypothetical protein